MLSKSLVLALVALLPLSICAPASSDRRQQNAKAVYFLTNKATNSVVALKVGRDGTLSDGSVVSTGGNGESAIQAGLNIPAGPDSLSGTGAIRLYKNYLFAVNAGSNTISTFRINEDEPTQLELVGKPISSLGDFPNAIAVSEKLKQACVTNIGASAGIACFHISPRGELTPVSPLRIYPLNQTNPPLIFTNGPLTPEIRATFTSINFNQDSSALIATITGNPVTGLAGHLAIYPVDEEGIVAVTPELSTPNGTVVLFSSLNVPGSSNKIFITDAAYGSAVLEISMSGTATQILKTTIPNQLATCWATYSPATGTAFVTDALVNTFNEINLQTGTIVSSFKGMNSNLGYTDIAAANDRVFALSPGFSANATAVAVLDVSGGAGKAKQIQNFVSKYADVGISAQGMQVYTGC